MRHPLALAVLLAGCVVRVASPTEGVADAPLPPPVDFGEVDQRLDALLAAPDDVDQRDRLQAALVLARKAKTDDAATQRVVLGYLQQVVAIEERSRSYSAPVLPSVPRVESFEPIGADLVVEEPLDALEPVPDDAGPVAGGAEGQSADDPPEAPEDLEPAPAPVSTPEVDALTEGADG